MAFSDKEVEKRLKDLEGWKKQNGTIKKSFKFANFLESMQFVDTVAGISEELKHHPEIKISYTSVEMATTTHDEEGLTENDFLLAQCIEEAYKKIKKEE